MDELLDRLEGAIARLADGRAPLEELVASHGEAVRLVGEAQARLDALSERAQRLGARHR
ncbi:MAG: exodeoxyribonuclease VII small subunit [Candidatus Dormibacteraceae bacterium]